MGQSPGPAGNYAYPTFNVEQVLDVKYSFSERHSARCLKSCTDETVQTLARLRLSEKRVTSRR
jgi:hypothetical protein